MGVWRVSVQDRWRIVEAGLERRYLARMTGLATALMLIPMAFIAYAAFCNGAYLVAVAYALRHAAPGKKKNYLLNLSISNLNAAEACLLPSGKTAHELVLERLGRGMRATFTAIGITVATILVMAVAEIAGLLGDWGAR